MDAEMNPSESSCKEEPSAALSAMNEPEEVKETISESSPDLDRISKSSQDFDPRDYQIKVFEVALRTNTISVQDTGSGKTMIAVMLIREIGRQLRSSCKKSLMIFLAPTVFLVTQQCEVIRIHTKFRIADYYGSKGIDEWNAKCWEREINSQEVMVMTPQILLDALRNAFLSLEMVRLLIFDECHHATGNHPYAKIMSEFYQKAKNRPKIFGMTASPVVRKGVSSVSDCVDQIAELEGILDSKIFSVDRAEMEIFVTTAKEINRYYNPVLFLHEDLKTKLESVWTKFELSVAHLELPEMNNFKDTIETYKALRKKLSSCYGKILYCIDNLGLTGAYEATKVCMEKVGGLISFMGCIFPRTTASKCKNFLEEVQHLIEEALPHVNGNFLETECDMLEAIKMGYVSPKLCELLNIIQSFGKSQQVVCMIFVERIITAKVIERFIKNRSYLSHFTVSYLTGGSSSIDALTPKMQKNTLDLFRSGKVNLLFTTDVAEEGIDLHNCSYVIRFDLPKTVRSYVQSRGRARRNDSHYFLMLERGNNKQRDMLFDVIRSERSMRDIALNKDPDTFNHKVCWKEPIDVYVVESTGATITPDHSVSLIYKYCERLPGDKFFTPRPNFQLALVGGSYECTLNLPPNAAFQEIKGPICRNSHLSKQLVCLQACKKLHKMGALDHHLLPITEDASKNDLIQEAGESDSGAGTTKRKERHGTAIARDLSGNWVHEADGVTLQAYRIKFSCNQIAEQYCGFVLLVEAKLDNDVANAEVDLFLADDKVVKSFVSLCGQCYLGAAQVKKSKLFQEFFFNALFGKLFSAAKSCHRQREFLFKTENNSLWSTSNMYVLLPLEPEAISSQETLSIDWKGIDACVYAVDFLRSIYSRSAQYCSIDSMGRSFCSASSTLIGCQESDVNVLANGCFTSHQLKNMVVLAVHTGRIYSVVDVMYDTTADSAFEITSDVEPASYASYTDYFYKKYQIVLQHPGRPLLHLKQSHNPHNLLLSKSENEGGAFDKNARDAGASHAKKRHSYVSMPPELLVNLDVSRDVLKSFYLLPSLMHRLESLLLANQLGKEIALQIGYQIPTYRILEAVTTQRCCEDFSMERLELLGDSVLKYAVSCSLFLKYPAKHEGQLSARRISAVRNSTLHKLATNRKLQGYIRDGAFDPRRWVAPGQLPTRPVPCNCGVDTLEVPLGKKFQTYDITAKIGVPCDRGHRWMCSKTIADCAEALIGAYYVDGGLKAALAFMKWLGVDAEFDPTLVEVAKNNASMWCYHPKVDDIEALESIIGYKFSVKGLLLEAITHASQQELGTGYCYQRLEFLGDSVLDLLITSYLFKSHTDIDPGLLTDLRSASVNNENFAQIAVKHNLQQHLRHGSGLLLGQITEYVKCVTKSQVDRNSLISFKGTKGPKVLGDIVESIAGAILIDTDLNEDEVWMIFKQILSPVVTPDKLHLHPARELGELCSRSGYFVSTKCMKEDEQVVVELSVQLKDDLLVERGCKMNKKAAKEQAAFRLLLALEEKGIASSQYASKRKHHQQKTDESFHPNLDVDISMPQTDSNFTGPTSKKQKIIQSPLSVEPSAYLSSADGHHHDCSQELPDPKLTEKVKVSIDMRKGGPRNTLYELCKRLSWLRPTFQSKAEGLRFTSRITLHVPNSDVIELNGEQRLDKKSSQDSAALCLLYELGRQGKCIIEDC